MSSDNSPFGGKIHPAGASALRSRWNPKSVVDKDNVASLVEALRPATVPAGTYCGLPASIEGSFAGMVRRVAHQADEWVRSAVLHSNARFPNRSAVSMSAGGVEDDGDVDDVPKRSSLLLAAETSEVGEVRDALLRYSESALGREVDDHGRRVGLSTVAASWLDWALQQCDDSDAAAEGSEGENEGEAHGAAKERECDASGGSRDSGRKRPREEDESVAADGGSDRQRNEPDGAEDTRGTVERRLLPQRVTPLFASVDRAALLRVLTAGVLTKRRQLQHPEEVHLRSEATPCLRMEVHSGQQDSLKSPGMGLGSDSTCSDGTCSGGGGVVLVELDADVAIRAVGRCIKRLRTAVQKERRLLKALASGTVDARSASTRGHAKEPTAAATLTTGSHSPPSDGAIPLVVAVQKQTAAVVTARDRFAAAQARFTAALRDMQEAAEDAIIEADDVAAEEGRLGDLVDGVAAECDAVNELRLLLVRLQRDMKQAAVMKTQDAATLS